MSRLDDIQAQLDAATPGERKAWDRGIGYEVHQADDWPLNDRHRETFAKGDAEFIAAAPENTRYLLDLVRKQQAGMDAVRELHRPDSLGRCTCTQNYAIGPWAKWPCPTVEALEAKP